MEMMDFNSLSVHASVLLAISVASERLVAIIKGVIPWLNDEKEDTRLEGYRTASLQALAVGAGIITALATQPALRGVLAEQWSTLPGILALGCLASGGSGFWNALLGYTKSLKDTKKALAKMHAGEVS